MQSYLTLFAISVALALVFTPLARRVATLVGAVDLPDQQRRIHRQPTPRLGGLAIYLTLAVALLCALGLGTTMSQEVRGELTRFKGVLLPGTIIFLLGVYDDIRGLGAVLKTAVQVIAATLLYLAGYGVVSLSVPFAGSWDLPAWLSLLLTVAWVVGITNAFNLIDGIDGLATGASIFALLSILFFSLATNRPEAALISLILTGAAIGFLYYNFNPATIFLGDSGSLLLGFMVAALSLASSQKGTTVIAIAIPLVSFGLPVLEVGLSITRRFVGGRPVMQSDRGHIHHRLLDHGLNQRQVVILLYGVCALFSLFGILLLNPTRIFSAFVLCVLGVLVAVGVQRLRYPEFEVLGNQLRQGMRREAVAANVRLRQAGLNLPGMRSPDQLFAALAEILEADEFDGARLELDCATAALRLRFAEAARDSGWRALGLDRAGESERTAWTWERAGRRYEEMSLADQFWALRLPLNDGPRKLGEFTLYCDVVESTVAVDLRSLCGPFRLELSRALALLIEARAADGRQGQPLTADAGAEVKWMI